MVCGHCINVIVKIKEIIEIATQANSFCFVTVDSTKIALHTYHVMVDRTIVLSISLLIAPKMHRIVIVSSLL